MPIDSNASLNMFRGRRVSKNFSRIGLDAVRVPRLIFLLEIVPRTLHKPIDQQKRRSMHGAYDGVKPVFQNPRPPTAFAFTQRVPTPSTVSPILSSRQNILRLCDSLNPIAAIRLRPTANPPVARAISIALTWQKGKQESFPVPTQSIR